MDSEIRVHFEECFLLQYDDGLYYYYRLNPELDGKGFQVDTRATVRVRKSDLKFNGPELMHSLSNGTKPFKDFLGDERVLRYIRKVGGSGDPNAFYNVNINGTTHKVSRNVMDVCDCLGISTPPVWIHALLAQKLGEWVEPMCLVFAMNLVEKIACDNKQKVLDDPLGSLAYQNGFEKTEDKAVVEASDGTTYRLPTGAGGSARKRAAKEAFQAHTGESVSNKVQCTDLESVRAELQMNEMRRMSDINIRQMERTALYHLTCVESETRLKRFRHMLDMIRVFYESEDSPGPICMDDDEAARCNVLFKNVFFEAFSAGETFVASSQMH
eukprot:jgi/Mesvir1/8603/Mv05621-RA.1